MYSFHSEPKFRNEQIFVGQQEYPTDAGSFQFNTSSSSYLSYSASVAPFEFGSENFNIECWACPSISTNERTLLSLWDSATVGQWFLRLESGNGARFLFHDVLAGSTSISAQSELRSINNAWVHIAVSRVGSTFRIFMNGIERNINPITHAGSLFTRGSASIFRVGSTGPTTGANFFEGFITGIRIIKGRALYTDNFIPPLPSEITAVANTVLLLNPANRSTFLNDTSGNGYNMTNNNTVRYSPARPNASLRDWRVWSKPPGAKLISITCIGAGGGGGSSFVANFNTARGGGAGGSSGAISTATLPAKFVPDILYVQPGSGGLGGNGNGAHGGVGGSSVVSLMPYLLQVSQNDYSSMYCYAEGGKGGLATLTNAGGAIVTAPTAATSNNSPLSAAGITNFTPGSNATAGATNASTDLTWSRDGVSYVTGGGGGSGSQASDNASGGRITTASSAGILPLISSVPYPNSNTGYSSRSFVAGTQYYQSALSANLALGTGSYTIEFWWNNGFTSAKQDLVSVHSSNANNRISIYHSNNTLFFAAGSNSTNYNTRTTYAAANTLFQNKWSHIAVSRSGTDTKLFVDGTQQGSTFTGDNLNFNQNSQVTVGKDAATAVHMTGAIGPVRVIKNEALYTVNFTAPTTPPTLTNNTIFLVVDSINLVDRAQSITMTNFSSSSMFSNPFDNNQAVPHGVALDFPRVYAGGAGGAGRGIGIGGDGGDGAIGSGGGGAGGGTVNFPKGGSGGPGAVIIRSW